MRAGGAGGGRHFIVLEGDDGEVGRRLQVARPAGRQHDGVVRGRQVRRRDEVQPAIDRGDVVPEPAPVVLPPVAAEAQAVHGVQADAEADEEQREAQRHEALPGAVVDGHVLAGHIREPRRGRAGGLRVRSVVGVLGGRQPRAALQHHPEDQQQAHAQRHEQGVEDAAPGLETKRGE